MPNLRLKGNTFDSAHLSHLISHEQVFSHSHLQFRLFLQEIISQIMEYRLLKKLRKEAFNKSMADPSVGKRLKTASQSGSTKRG